MKNALARKLGRFADFSDRELRALDRLCRNSSSAKAGADLIQEGERPESVFLLLDGWACRYKMLPDGRRQNMAYLLPGDVCDVYIFVLSQMDHSIDLLSDATYAEIPKEEMLAIMREFPKIGEALWWATLVDEAVLREWLVNLGQRFAYERVTHLFCELWLRLNEVGLTKGHQFTLPLTQEQLGNTVGLTPVHVNRTLQKLREEGLITLKSQELVILDIERMREIADFDPKYLHLQRRD